MEDRAPSEASQKGGQKRETTWSKRAGFHQTRTDVAYISSLFSLICAVQGDDVRAHLPVMIQDVRAH